MCGIAGIINFDKRPVPPRLLKKMTDVIAHRGPDGEGCYVDRFAGLGHRRLAILDLTRSGHQPMQSADSRYSISYNGEVYNFNAIRTELEVLGYCFASNTDTEVVLNAYKEWGKSSLDKFNGMFAFAIWDQQKEELFIARDRYGIKPLYYFVTDTIFIFASEVKAILAHPQVAATVDKEALLEYFTFQNLFTNRTLFQNVQLFPAGSYMRISCGKGDRCTPVKYWDYNFAEPTFVKDEREYKEELDRLFTQAVKRQLVSDVELGAFLSGGMDSGSITAVAASQLSYIKTFTCGFDLTSASGLELGYDERGKAEEMSYLFKTEHYEMVLKAGDMERVLPRLAQSIEEPRVGQSYPNFYAAHLASKFVKVVLSGGGGDELFGGYPWRYYRAVVNNDFEHYIDKYYLFWQRLIPNNAIHNIFKPILNDVKHVWTRDVFRDVFQKHAASLTRPEDYINHSLYFEAKTFLHGLLVVEDKLSMAHGLEVRVPFLDNDLVDFAMNMPVALKLGNLNEVIKLNENEPGRKTEKYFKKTHDGKKLLREVMEKYIPPSVTNRPKQGFSAPDASWFRGDSIDYIKNLLYNKDALLYNYMDAKEVQLLMDEHLSGKRNRRLLIWSLLSFEWFLKTFIDS